jgi:hypothetical protein
VLGARFVQWSCIFRSPVCRIRGSVRLTPGIRIDFCTEHAHNCLVVVESMVYGSAAVMPTSNNEITEADEGTHGGVTTSLPRVAQPTALLSVQSDPSILSKPKPQKHRRYNSMFSIFSNDHSSSPATEPRSPSSSTLKKTSSGITSGDSSGTGNWEISGTACTPENWRFLNPIRWNPRRR